MPNINITVAGKIATNTTPGQVIVCGNSDYTVTFDLDAEWAAEPNRTARFVYYRDGLSLYQDVAFTGNTAAVPVLSGISYVLVGVYAGNLRTTTPAKVLCDRSILCGDPLEVLTPEEKARLQAQIGDLSKLTTQEKSNLVAAINEATGAGLTTAQVEALDGMFKVCAFTKEDVSAEYNAFLIAFGISGGEEEPDTPVTPEKTLTSISAVYSGGDVAVGTAVTSLTGVVVTAHYSDGTSEVVTGYTLSGTIAEGSNTVTVSYGGKATTITVTGVAESGGDDGEVSYSDGYINDSGVLTALGNNYVNNKYDTVTGRNIGIATGLGSAISSVRIAEYDSERNFIKRQYMKQSGHAAGAFTLSDNTAFVRVGFEASSGTDLDALFRNYEYQCNDHVWESGYVNGTTGEIASHNSRYVSELFDIDGGRNYTLYSHGGSTNFALAEYSTDGTFIIRNFIASGTELAFTTNANTAKARISFENTAGKIYGNLLFLKET